MVGAAAGDGRDVVERPLAGAERAQTIKALAGVAFEDAGAETRAAEVVGTRPGAGLAGGVAFDFADGEGEFFGRGRVRERGGDFVGQENFKQAAAAAAFEEAHDLFAGQHTEIVPRGAGAQANGAGEVVARDADGAASFEARVAQQVDVECALVRREAQRREQYVFHLAPDEGEIEFCGQERNPQIRRQVTGGKEFADYTD